MSEPQRTDMLQQLCELLVNGTISAEEHDELQSLLVDSPDAQSQYLDFIDLHVGLQKLTAAGPSDELQLTSYDGARGAVSPAVSPWRSVIAVVLTLAVVVVLLLALSVIQQRDDNSNPQQAGDSSPNLPSEQSPDDREIRQGEVILTQAAGAELFGEFLPSVGETLDFNHEYALTAGMIGLRFPDGAEVILEAPSIVEIADRDRLIVSMGRCSVHAPPGAEGFQVETPQTEIVDMGTRFSVTVSEVGATDVQVVEGLAEVRARHSEATDPVRLAAHHARRFNGDIGAGAQSLEFDAGDYRKTLPDRVVSYLAKPAGADSVSELESVTLQRGGRVVTFPVSDLIGVKVTHFRAGANNANVAVQVGYDVDRLAGLEADSLLHTGVLNPGGSIEPLVDDPVLAGPSVEDGEATPGLAIRFRKAVVNQPGPDVVFFELQTVVNPPEGDAFHVSPLKFGEGLRSYSIRKYDIAMTSREAQPLPHFDLYFFRESPSTLAALMTGAVDRRRQTLRFRALAVGIDLSDLGYADDAAVDGLFFQDALDDGDVVDPVFIAGLPWDEVKDTQ